MMELFLGAGAPTIVWVLVGFGAGAGLLLRGTLGGVAKVKHANAHEIEARGKVEIALARLQTDRKKSAPSKRTASN